MNRAGENVAMTGEDLNWWPVGRLPRTEAAGKVARHPELAEFLRAHPAHAEYDEIWPLRTPVPLHGRLGFSDELPPVQFRSSIQGIVVRADRKVLFLWPATPSGNFSHLIVGGRPEGDETPEETLIREVGEESGWRVRPIALLGFRHFRHLGPLTDEMADRPYPEFLQPIYAAVAEAYDPALLLLGENPCEFVDAAWAERVTQVDHRPLLIAALLAAGLG